MFKSFLWVISVSDSAGCSGEPKTYALSQYFNAITERLLATSSRPDGGQHNLRNAAYSALMALMRSATKDCYTEVQRVTVIVLERLESVIGLENHLASNQDRAQFIDLQSLLCGTLQSVLRKINKEDAPAISDKVRLFLTLRQTRFHSRESSCHSLSIIGCPGKPTGIDCSVRHSRKVNAHLV